MNQAIVLFAHGARDPEWAGPVNRLAAMLQVRHEQVLVQPAFLEFMSPGFDQAVDDLVARGAGRIQVVPIFLAQGGHLKRDLPLLIERAARRHPTCLLRLSAAVGEDQGVLAAMGDFALAELARTDA